MRYSLPGIASCLALALGCAPHGPTPENGGTPPPVEPAVGDGAEDAGVEPVAPEVHAAVEPARLCLAFATCGCFAEEECAAVPVREDGYTVDIVEGSHAGETGHLMQHCLGEGAAPAGCVDYVDPAIVCRRASPSSVEAAKYTCAADELHPDFACGFEDGACTVL